MQLTLYTFILDYAGGTYISQYRDQTANEAVRAWIAGEVLVVPGFKEKHREKIRGQFEDYGMVAIDTVVGVWLFDFTAKKNTGWLHVVRTRE